MIRLILFDIDGTLVHTGHAGTQAFKKTFATEFNLHHGAEKMKFAGRTDVSLVREFFKIHALPKRRNISAQFFERYVFWLDHILAHSDGETCAAACANSSATCRRCQIRPCSACSPATSASARNSSCATSGCGRFFSSAGLRTTTRIATTSPPPRLNAPNACSGKICAAEEIVVIGDTPFDVRCGKFIGAKVLAVATGGATLDELKKCPIGRWKI
jgi:phosphoglycolate phosphatase